MKNNKFLINLVVKKHNKNKKKIIRFSRNKKISKQNSIVYKIKEYVFTRRRLTNFMNV